MRRESLSPPPKKKKMPLHEQKRIIKEKYWYRLFVHKIVFWVSLPGKIRIYY